MTIRRQSPKSSMRGRESEVAARERRGKGRRGRPAATRDAMEGMSVRVRSGGAAAEIQAGARAYAMIAV